MLTIENVDHLIMAQSESMTMSIAYSIEDMDK